ncbi:MAG: LysM peptidoglycan-binding domain-containing protein [Chloroflexi bacterium]|nr:LysM peptidoglycan-binding domain-containing protein [Chloroflexota bacterium]
MTIRRIASFLDNWHWALLLVAAPFLLFPLPTRAASPTATATLVTYIVVAGDTLARIASRFGVTALQCPILSSGSGNARLLRVVVLGAGDAGAMIVKEMRSNPQRGLEPVAFLDDDWRKYGARIHGVPIVGGRQKIVFHTAVLPLVASTSR